MIKIKLLIILAFIGLLNSGCLPIYGEPKGGLIKLINSNEINIDSIYRERIGDLSEWIKKAKAYENSGEYFVFKNELFQEMYRNPNIHFNLSIGYLSDKTVSITSKLAVIKMLQCLDIEDYLKLGEIVIELKNEKISTTYLSPGPEYGFLIDKYFENKQVRELLARFNQMQPNLAGTIELILTGENIKRYNELIRFGERLPVLICQE